MRYRLIHFVSSFLLFGILAGGLTFSVPVQNSEVEVESEVYLRSQSFTYVLQKKVRSFKHFIPILAKQVEPNTTKRVSPSAQIAHANIGNSLYLLNSCFLI